MGSIVLSLNSQRWRLCPLLPSLPHPWGRGEEGRRRGGASCALYTCICPHLPSPSHLVHSLHSLPSIFFLPRQTNPALLPLIMSHFWWCKIKKLYNGLVHQQCLIDLPRTPSKWHRYVSSVHSKPSSKPGWETNKGCRGVSGGSRKSQGEQTPTIFTLNSYLICFNTEY